MSITDDVQFREVDMKSFLTMIDAIKGKKLSKKQWLTELAKLPSKG